MESVLEILKEKVKEGVEVRFLYDGMCCLSLLPYHYPQELESYGIQCHMFAPIVPALSTGRITGITERSWSLTERWPSPEVSIWQMNISTRRNALATGRIRPS